MRFILLLCVCVAVCLAAEVTSDLDAAAAEFDVLIEQALADQQQVAQPACDDSAFLRRAWLDLGGRIPTASEAQKYFADPSKDKRRSLLAALIGSPSWNLATYSWLADVLRVESRLQDRVPGQAWIDWLKTAVRDNRPWDVMARDMITATGALFVEGGGATGFAIRDTGMPLDHAALMAQTFLGTRIGCAQCHDHPFDRWTRLDFLRFAAFTADARTVLPPPGTNTVRKMLEEESNDVRNVTKAMGVILGARVVVAAKDWLPVPNDYQYDDAKPGTKIRAQALFSPAAPAHTGGDPRPALAAWMTSSANPRFALTIGNRVWKRLFGRGLVEPVDDLSGEPDQVLPALQARLARLVVDCHFDLRQVHLVLVSTQHWQRQAWVGEPPAHGGVTPGRPAVRISAQAWWDSLVALAVDDPETAMPDEAAALYRVREQLVALKPDALVERARQLVDLRKAGLAGLADADAALVELAQALRMTAKNAVKAKRVGREPLRRAAEMPQPAPPGHPLRVLGQSDRQLIDNANVQPTTVQALLLMNGVIDVEVLSARSRLMHELNGIKDPAAQIDHLWLAVLTRHPTAAELARALPEVHERVRIGLPDIAWVLLNGAEFRMTP